jgi:hypothetical protein
VCPAAFLSVLTVAWRVRLERDPAERRHHGIECLVLGRREITGPDREADLRQAAASVRDDASRVQRLSVRGLQLHVQSGALQERVSAGGDSVEVKAGRDAAHAGNSQDEHDVVEPL